MLETHLDDTTVTANASMTDGVDPSLSKGEETETETDEADEDEEVGGVSPLNGAG